MESVDADVAELVRQDRLVEAARLSSARGDPRCASSLFERACDWRAAAAEALRAGDGSRGLSLALRSGDEALALEAVRRISADPLVAERTAVQLIEGGRLDWGARLFEAVGRDLDAAGAWERAGELRRAALMFERAREPAQAARVLENALRRDPQAGDAALALGVLLLRFGKDEAGLRALQRVPSSAPERPEALHKMIGPLRRLGLGAAASQALAELSSAPGPADADGSHAPAQWVSGRYEVVRLLASSPYARMLEAVDRASGERVAIKVFSRSDGGAALDRLENEVRAVRAIAHPAIVPIRDLLGPGPAVVMSWMPGGTLDQMLSDVVLAPARCAEIACSLLAALAAAHRAGILHRDVKPTNVLFDSAGAAYLSDFGTTHASNASATVTAGDLGMLAYQSSEQRQGREMTARSDIFAVGVLLEQMLTGRSPGAAALAPRLSDSHPGLDARHDRLVASLTATAAHERTSDALQGRDWIQSLPWPEVASRHRDVDETTRQGRAREFSSEDRLRPEPDGTLWDVWTGREVQCVALSDQVLTRARLFAAADDGALQPVLRVDREGGRLWLAACRPLGLRPLTDGEQRKIARALERLRVAGAHPASLNAADSAGLAVDAADSVVVRF